MTDIIIADVVKQIPPPAATSLHKSLLDILLKSKNAPSLPPTLAKRLLTLYHDDKLSSPEGFQTLLEASVTLEKEKTVEKLQEMNLNDAASQLKGD